MHYKFLYPCLSLLFIAQTPVLFAQTRGSFSYEVVSTQEETDKDEYSMDDFLREGFTYEYCKCV